MADQAIYISNVHKSYGKLHVLKGVNLDVRKGEVFGLLGPNGAGKTTLTHTILGLLKPDDGTVRLLGSNDHEKLAARIGYLPERPRYHTQFTGREYLQTLGKLSNLSGQTLHDRVDEVIEMVGLEQAADRRIGTYSKGMLQRIGIAQAVLHKPDLLIIDEPASGLDPGGQREMALLLKQLSDEDHTIFLCTHHLSDVTRLCDRVGVLVNGRLDHVASVADIQSQGHSVTINIPDLPLETAQALQQLGPQVRAERTAIVLFPTSDRLLSAVLRHLLDDGVVVQSVIPEADALEQFYLNAVRQPPQEDPQPTPEQPEELLETLIEDR